VDFETMSSTRSNKILEECGNNLSSGRIPAPTGAAVCPQNTSEICGDTAAVSDPLFMPASYYSLFVFSGKYTNSVRIRIEVSTFSHSHYAFIHLV